MSRILKDLMASSPQQQGDPSDSEPRFNPLAGSSEHAPTRPWRTALLVLAYGLVIAIIAWQGWLLASRAFAPVSPVESADVSEPPIVVADGTAPEADEPTPASAPAESAVESQPDSQLAPIALPRGTDDLPQPPLVEPQTPDRGSADEEIPLTEEATDSSIETTLIDDRSTEPADDTASQSADISPAAAEEPETTQPDIASVSDSTASRQRAEFSDTRRNRALNQAQALYQAGREDEALLQLAQWLREDDHTDVRQYYARLLLRADRAEEARYIVRPDYNRQELELRAYADFQVNAFRDSLRHYSTLLDRADTIQTEWYLWLAICHDNLSETSQAVAYYQTFLDQNGNQPDSLVQHARERLAALSG